MSWCIQSLAGKFWHYLPILALFSDLLITIDTLLLKALELSQHSKRGADLMVDNSVTMRHATTIASGVLRVTAVQLGGKHCLPWPRTWASQGNVG